ncbi:uncharacterized protein LOC131927953 [Physella acuta]|uniref:uncharacterized protein LOC131927953 n=1 Tax=Physella acuta TaxID=109671 RepID=UPI0027DBD23E|nr:uncharacterized protein LOC131927953 [Physella acuta]
MPTRRKPRRMPPRPSRPRPPFNIPPPTSGRPQTNSTVACSWAPPALRYPARGVVFGVDLASKCLFFVLNTIYWLASYLLSWTFCVLKLLAALALQLVLFLPKMVLSVMTQVLYFLFVSVINYLAMFVLVMYVLPSPVSTAISRAMWHYLGFNLFDPFTSQNGPSKV